ncbi:hypothetical protein [Pontibacter kalidii]|uniref:hypothetical protein n=1 Tax=Pontibacter kalidii TaxID=2592049 RepID=UPI00225B71E8|nr:hypothetical protein [Pontibacter kalidii]
MQNDKQTVNDITSTTARVAGAIGKGIVAGLIGTAAMTIAQMLEMRQNNRESSDTPYQAAKKVFGVKAEDEDAKENVNNLMHFAYGTAWGIPRALLAEFGMSGTAGTLTHLGAVWGTELAVMPQLGVMEPATEWKPAAIGKDLLFHTIYAVATGLVVDALVKGTEENKEA